MKHFITLSAVFLLATIALAGNPKPHFISSMQMAIHEGSPELLLRSQRLVMQQMDQSLSMFPEMRGKRIDVRTQGNEVILIMSDQEDLRSPFKAAVAQAIEHLNGKVRARGKSMFYRTSLAEQMNGYLEVVLNDERNKIVTIEAQSVPLRDLLKEIKQQTGGSLSYLIPGECADKLVDWSFNEGGKGVPKEMDAVVSDLATLFGMKVENRNNTFIFTGACANIIAKNNPQAEMTMQRFFDPSIQAIPISTSRVFVPIAPLSE